MAAKHHAYETRAASENSPHLVDTAIEIVSSILPYPHVLLVPLSASDAKESSSFVDSRSGMIARSM